MKSRSVFQLALCFLALQLSGCSGVVHKPLETGTRSIIQTVSVDENVSLPDTVFFFGSKKAIFGALGGAVGAVAGQAVSSDEAMLKALLKDNDIQVGQILRSELIKQLNQTKVFPEVTNSSADAHINISVTNYGLFKKSAFNGNLRAAIWVDVSLVSSAGKVLWQKTVKPRATEDRVPAYDFSYYQSNPEALRQGFETLSSLIATELVNDIQR